MCCCGATWALQHTRAGTSSLWWLGPRRQYHPPPQQWSLLDVVEDVLFSLWGNVPPVTSMCSWKNLKPSLRTYLPCHLLIVRQFVHAVVCWVM